MKQDYTSELEDIPHKFTLTVTSKCNFRCPTCLFLLNDKNHFSNKGFISLDDYKKILIKYKNNMRMLTLTGGEPTLHPDFDELINFAISLGLNVGFPTNGSLILDHLDYFKKVNGFRISLDAYDVETFKKGRNGTEQTWNKIIEGMNLLKQNNIKFDISFLITKNNIEEIYRMIDFATTVGPNLVNFHSFNPHSYSRENVLLANDEKVKEVFSDIMDNTLYPFDIIMPYVFDEESSYFKEKICSYPWVQASINENGDVGYCCHMAHDRSIGNIFEGYDFNSDKIQQWRKSLINHNLTKHCYFCHRRFLGDYPTYSARDRKWSIPRSFFPVQF